MADENETRETDETPLADETARVSEETPSRMTGEKAVDIALGAAILAAEAASRAVQQISEQAEKVRENAPAILQSMEEKGRPIRESLVNKLQGGTFAAQSETSSAPAENADDEITALEQRVRELEYQVSAPPAAPLPAEDSNVFATAVSTTPPPAEAKNSDFDTEVFGTASEETPAEAATFDPFPPRDALADSPYAVSETEDEARSEGDETPSEMSLPAVADAAADADDTAPENGEEKAKGRKKAS